MYTRLCYLLAAVFALTFMQMALIGCSDSAKKPGDGGFDGSLDGGAVSDAGDDGDGGGGDGGKCKANQADRCGICQPKRCQEASHCNPGQYCEQYECKNDFQFCSAGECEVPGMHCVEDKFCKFDKCDLNGGCPQGLVCFNTYCIEKLPCGIDTGTWCKDDEVCLTTNNKCIPKPPTGCDITCQPGMVKVFTDPEASAFDTCTKFECSCESLPSIPLGQFGYYSAVVVKGGEGYAAAYNKTYGDLVLLKFTFDDPAMPEAGLADPKSMQFVDGVPATGVIGGDPNGPRHGIVTPGPDVGYNPSIALAGDGNFAISYFEKNAATGEKLTARLKYAKFDGTSWAVHVVDGADVFDGSDQGRYSSLAFDSEGKPHIVYFRKNGPYGPDHLKSYLMLARAKNPAPVSRDDWTLTIIDVQPVSCRAYEPSTESHCAADEACVQFAPVGACAKKSEACSPACASDKVCVLDAASKAVCADPLKNGVPEIPEGTGMFPSLVIGQDQKDYIAFYDHAPKDFTAYNGNLKGGWADASSSGWFILDGVDSKGNKTADVGRFASLRQDYSGAFGIAYYDATFTRLKYWTGPFAAGGTIEIVATGISPGAKDFAGPDCSLAFDAGNIARIAFQNASAHTLNYAVRAGGSTPWPPENQFVLLDPVNPAQVARFGNGGYGFFAKQVIDGQVSYIVNMKIGFKITDPDAGEYEPDNRLILYKKGF